MKSWIFMKDNWMSSKYLVVFFALTLAWTWICGFIPIVEEVFLSIVDAIKQKDAHCYRVVGLTSFLYR